MENNTEEKKTSSKNSLISLASSVLVLFNGIFTAYVIVNPKIGEYHIWLCSALGVLLALFTVWTVVWCIRSLKKGEGGKTMLVHSTCAFNGHNVDVYRRAILQGLYWRQQNGDYGQLSGGSRLSAFP